jgi:hypothetical protein
VIEWTFRNASICGGEVTLWANSDISRRRKAALRESSGCGDCSVYSVLAKVTNNKPPWFWTIEGFVQIGE